MKVELHVNSETQTEAEVRGYVGKQEVIRLVNYGQGWSVGLSSCLPTDLQAAYNQERVVQAAFTLVKDYEMDLCKAGECHLLGVDETMKGLAER